MSYGNIQQSLQIRRERKMKNKRLKRSLWISIPCFLFSVFYILYFVAGCGLNNPFTPPEPRGPNLIYPKNGDTKDIGKITFSWDIVPGREEYQFQLSKSANFSSSIVDTKGLLDSRYEHNFSGTDTIEYFWRAKVKYKVPSVWSKWSAVWSFVICPGHENHPPVTPYNPSPSDNAIDVSVALTLIWTSGDPDPFDIVTYTIYFGKDSLSPESTFTIADSSGADTTTVLYPLSYSLDYGVEYFWKVEARDQHTMSAGPMWRFTTSLIPNEPPNKPQTPTGPSWVYADKSCTFTTSTTDPEGDSVAYIFDFGDGVKLETPLVASGEIGSADHIYIRLGTFYVKAQAKDKGGSTSEWSDSTSILVKADSGTCWVADDSDEKAVRISAKGSRLCEAEAGGIYSLAPVTLDVDPQTGWCWEASTYPNRTHRISPACDIVKEHTFGEVNPSTPCVDGNGYCWYVLSWTRKLIKVDENWNIVHTINDLIAATILTTAAAIDLDHQTLWVAENGLTEGRVSKFLCSGTTPEFRLSGIQAGRLDVDQVTHWCWAPDNGNNRVVKISPDGSTVESFSGFNGPLCVSVDSYTHCCWVADELNNRVVKLSEDGTELCVATGFDHPSGVEADPLDHGCWVSDRDNNRVVKLDANCDTLFTVGGFITPRGLSVNPNPDP